MAGRLGLLAASLVALLVFSAPATAQGVEPEFEMDLTIEHEGEIEPVPGWASLTAKVAVTCTQWSPVLVENIRFDHHLRFEPYEKAEEFKFAFPEHQDLPFSPDDCLEQRTKEYTFSIAFQVPLTYPALSPVAIGAVVKPEGGIGEAHAEWEGRVAFEGHTTVRLHSFATRDTDPVANIDLFVANWGNGIPRGTIKMNNSTEDGLSFEPTDFGPIKRSEGVDLDIPVHFDESVRALRKDFRVAADVVIWIEGYPDTIVYENTLSTEIRSGPPRSDPPPVPTIPAPPLVLVLTALALYVVWHRP